MTIKHSSTFQLSQMIYNQNLQNENNNQTQKSNTFIT